MKLPSFLLFTLASIFSFGQESQLDSMLRIVSSMPDDTNKVLTYNKIGDKYSRLGAYDSCIYYGELADTLASKLGYLPGKASALNLRGVAYWYMGNHGKAIKLLFASLAIYDRLKDKKGIASELNNIGIVYAGQKNYPKALEYYIRTLKLKQELHDKRGISSTLINMGMVFESEKDYDKALNYYMQSLELKKELKERKGLAICLNNIGLLYVNKGDTTKGLDYLNQSLLIREELNDKTGIATSCNNLGNIYTARLNYAKAEEYLLRAKKISQEINNLELTSRNREELAKLYKQTKRYKEAYDALWEFHLANDSLNISANKKETEQLEMKHEFEKEKFELQKAQAIKNARDDKEREKQKIVTVLISISLVIVLIFSVFLFGRFRITQRQKSLIEKQKHLVDEKNKEILDSIHYAKRIQQTLLASHSLLDRRLSNYFIFYKPKDIVSGDFYYAYELPDRLILGVFDCTGHGVPGAFMSLLNVSFLNEAINEKMIVNPADILNYVRHRLIQSVSQDGGQDGMDGTIISLKAVGPGFEVQYAAANNAPVLIRDNSIIELECDKMPVGKGEKTSDFKLLGFKLEKGDCLYLYTDGYADQFGGPKGKKFMNKQLGELLLDIHSLPSDDQKIRLLKTFENWRGGLEQVDDICLMGIRF